MRTFLRFLGRFFLTLLVTVVILVGGIYLLMYIVCKGPSPSAGERFVLSVRETSMIGFLANWFYTDEEIAAIVEKSAMKQEQKQTDTSMVTVVSKGEGTKEEQEASLAQPEIEVVDIKGATYSGKMLIVKDPSRVFVGKIPQFGSGDGIPANKIGELYNAVGGINGGEFVDGAVTDTSTPAALVMSEGAIVHGDVNTVGHITGFTKDNILVLGTMSGQEALNMGMRDCVSVNPGIGPFLIINGESQDGAGMAGGLNPRTAIGQRADGSVLLLAVDGRQANSLGASFSDMIEIMMEYDAVNASCMDGGTSTQIFYEGEVINNPYSPWGARPCPTAFLVGGVE